MDGEHISLMRFLLLAVAVLCVAQRAYADTQCWVWVDQAGTHFSSPEGAAKSNCELSSPTNKAYCDGGPNPNDSDYSYTVGSMNCTVSGDPSTGQSAQCSMQITTNHCLSNGNCYPPQPTTYNTGVSQARGACPPPNPCPAKAGQEASFTTASGAGCSGITKDADGCTMRSIVSVQVHGACAVGGYYTGNQDNTAPSSNAGSCVTGSGGTVCAESPKGKNCGTFNGDEVCVASNPPGTCQSYASGGVSCTTATGTNAVTSPPAPDNGTAGQPATPTGSVTQLDSSGNVVGTTNYYSSTVVNGSAGGTSTTPGGQNVGNGGTGSGSGTQQPPQGECEKGSCTGTVPTLEDLDSFQTMTQQFWNNMQNVPIVQAVQNLGAAIPAGQCPRPELSLDYFHTVLQFNAMCDLWEQIAGVITAVMVVIWALAGAKILLSA